MTEKSSASSEGVARSEAGKVVANFSDSLLLNALLESHPDHLYFKDRECRLLRSSLSHAKSSGFSSPDEMIGKTDFDFHDPDDARVFFENEQHIMATGEPMLAVEEKIIRKHTGQEYWVFTSKIPLHAEDGSIVGIIGIGRDITERKQAEAALRKAELQLVESEKMALLGQLIAGVAHEVNTPLGAIGAAVGNISGTLEQILQKLPGFFRDLPPEFEATFLDLVRRSVSPASPLSAREERQLRNTLRRRLQEEGIENADHVAEILVMMGISEGFEDLLPMLRHELGSQYLDMAYKLSGLGRSASIIATAGDRAGKVVFALKSYAHFDRPGEWAYAQVNEGIDTVLTLYHNQLKRGVVVERNYAPTPEIRCRPDELNQVWTNLIHNAIHAVNLQGTLSIRLETIEDGTKVRAVFSDTGHGIPAEIVGRIFDPFFTTKPAGEGSGLGLHIVRQIVEKHNGTISVQSEPGKGASFEVVLPVAGGNDN